jgi:hypothetical protein
VGSIPTTGLRALVSSCQQDARRRDISASYSTDGIGMSQPVRRPFSWRGGLWVCVGKGHREGVTTARIYNP